MHLGTATVDEAGSTTVDLADEVDHAVNLGVGRVQIVVVDIEAVRKARLARHDKILGGNIHSVGIDTASSSESDVDETIATKDAREDTRTDSTIFVEHLVDNVPLQMVRIVVSTFQSITHSIDLASVSTTKLLDVVFDDRGEGSFVADVVDPARELRVPDKGVTTNELAIAGSPVDKGIGTAKVELTAVGFNGIPLHRVLRRKLTELGAENGSVGSNVESVRIGAGTPELLALGTEPGVNTSGSSRPSWRGGGRSRRRDDGGAGGGSGNNGGCRARSGDSCRRSSCAIGREGFHQSEVS